MAGNENRATDCDRGPVDKFSEVCTATCTTEDKPRRVDNQVVTIAQRRERMLWQTFQLALEVDLNERTAESRLLRTLAHRAWGDAFLGRRVG